MTIYSRSKPLRAWLVSIDDAAKALGLTVAAVHRLRDEGYLRPAARKGFFRLGNLIDDYGAAIQAGVIDPRPSTAAED
ncbi:hypothetical protein [Rhizobium sp. BK602]|uniref:hypothetical protein n=1 Tax=Rhizobium sp. BK602 TaxID=2586986 RepID=UPI00161F41B2|nr:hypothetical protein [Rhizobium sp. BK602]MBB3610966.1 hypothetical protein [Rhizobium sp. BK602]